jgi:hypothetical protein
MNGLWALLAVTTTMLCAVPVAIPDRARADDVFGPEPIQGPVCRRQEVLDLVGNVLRPRAHYAHLDPDSVAEEPTTEPDVVHCRFCLTVPYYDTPVAGKVPLARCEPHEFDVRTLARGLVVRRIR